VSPDSVNRDTIVGQVLDVGVRPGGVLVVHTAFSEVRPVVGGPAGLIAALRDALGPDGTLAMPTMSSDDYTPFDPATTPCPDMGVVAEKFWRSPGVLRSNNPHAFAAIGPKAAEITAPHAIDVPHSLDSPVGRAYELDAQVLLLGVGHDANTTIHLAESIAGVRYRREKYVTVLEDGTPIRFQYREIGHCCQNFALLDGWLDEKGLQKRGIVGHGQARLSRARDIVKVALEHLQAEETVFLHPMGVDEECDKARRSLL